MSETTLRPDQPSTGYTTGIGLEFVEQLEGRCLADFEFPSDEVTQCPSPFYKALRDEAPVFKYPGRNDYIVSRRKDILHVLQHPEIFSNEVGKGDARLAGAVGFLVDAETPEGSILTPASMAQADPPEHTLKRRLAMQFLTKDVLDAFIPTIEGIADSLIDTFIDSGKVEFRTEFAEPLALLTICSLIGFPDEDRELYFSWERLGTGHGRRFLTEEQLAKQSKDAPAQADYISALIKERYANPGDDTLSRWIQAHVEREGSLNLPYLTSEATLMLMAGNETTSRALTNTMLMLLQNPDQLAKVLADPELIVGALEESIRVEAPTQWVSRLAVEDTEVGGVAIPKGAFVLVMYGSANRDENEWEDVNRFDVERPDVARKHMGFGGGIHLCLGAPVARREARVGIARFLDRCANIRFGEGNEFRNIDNFQKRVLTHLYLEFDKA